jgi:hypothetical protein
MIVAREALRLATVRALRGATIVGDRVEDSAHGAIEDWIPERPLPQVIVYTDDAKQAAPHGGSERGLYSGGTVSLTIEIIVTAKMRVEVEGEDEGGEWTWECPVTDASIELLIGYIANEVRAALHDPKSAWAEMWRRLVLDVEDFAIKRGTWQREGVRAAGQALEMTVRVPPDPTPGQTPTGVWPPLLALIEASAADFGNAGRMLAAMIAPPADDDWRAADMLQAALGLTADEMAALQLHSTAADDATVDDVAMVSP